MTDHQRLSERVKALNNRGGGQRIYRSEINDLAASASDLEFENFRLQAQLSVREKRTYERGNGHSWIADKVRVTMNRGDGDGGVKAAEARLAAHQREVDAELPRLLQRRDAAARAATETALTGSLAELRALERFTAAGGRIFEQRAVSRTDGQGGYFVGPLWAIEDFVPYALAGRPFANLWSSMPLPPHTDEINLPVVKLGPATGAQPSDLAPGRA